MSMPNNSRHRVEDRVERCLAVVGDVVHDHRVPGDSPGRVEQLLRPVGVVGAGPSHGSVSAPGTRDGTMPVAGDWALDSYAFGDRLAIDGEGQGQADVGVVERCDVGRETDVPERPGLRLGERVGVRVPRLGDDLGRQRFGRRRGRPPGSPCTRLRPRSRSGIRSRRPHQACPRNWGSARR